MTPSLEHIAPFRKHPNSAGKPFSRDADDILSLPDWSDDDWRDFLRHVELLVIPTGESLVRRGDADSNLYFVTKGSFEVLNPQNDGISLGILNRIGAGSTIGEVAFFDGGPRSAKVWSIAPSEVLRMTHEQFDDLESGKPRLARDLIYSLARILAIRLRMTTSRIPGNG